MAEYIPGTSVTRRFACYAINSGPQMLKSVPSQRRNDGFAPCPGTYSLIVVSLLLTAFLPKAPDDNDVDVVSDSSCMMTIVRYRSQHRHTRSAQFSDERRLPFARVARGSRCLGQLAAHHPP